MLAAFKLGAVPINVNYRYVEDELRYLLDDADARAVVFHAEFAPKLAAIAADLPELQTFIAVDDGCRDAGAVARSARSSTRPRSRPRAPTRDFARALRRRPLHPLHRRHDGHAEGRHVAPRRRLLRGDGWRGRRRRADRRRPRRSPSAAASRAPGACPRARSCTAPRTGWRSARCSPAARVVIPTEHHLDALALWELIAARAGELPRDRRRRVRPPAASTRSTPPPAARSTSRALRVLLSGGAILSPALKRALVERLPGVLVVDGYGASETGGQGQSVVVAGRRDPERAALPRRRPDTRCSDDDLRPVRAGRRRPPRPPRPHPARLLQGPGEDRGDVSRSSTACAGRCPATTPSSTTTARSRCSAAVRCRSTPAARRCTPKRSNRS